MDAEAFRSMLDRLGLSQVGAARFLDLDERTVRRWATGDGAAPRSVVLLFTLMERYGLKPSDF